MMLKQQSGADLSSPIVGLFSSMHFLAKDHFGLAKHLQQSKPVEKKYTSKVVPLGHPNCFACMPMAIWLLFA